MCTERSATETHSLSAHEQHERDNYMKAAPRARPKLLPRAVAIQIKIITALQTRSIDFSGAHRRRLGTHSKSKGRARGREESTTV